MAEGISKTYDGSRWAVKDVDLAVSEGTLVTLLGPNGAGKTTLVRILTTELAPTKGRLTIFGLDALKNPNLVRHRIASIPQEARPIDFATPYELVFSYLVMRGFSIRQAREEARRALEELDMWDIRDRVIHSLSGGLKRRTLVAMALASGAELVFLDEPTTGLDVVSRRSVWDALTRLKEKSTIILTTHYIEEAEFLSDEVVVMNNGGVVARGPVDRLLSLVGGEYVIEAYGAPEKVLEGYRYIKLNGRYLIYVDDEAEASAAVDWLVKAGARAMVRRKSLEDVVIGLIGHWEGGEGEQGD